ncbi:MAG: thioredoxin family protein [candidate division Zixibacteria bacterium]|nr:thioredoxin family protein [candidate division Zixibacteria bacterium]
MSDVIEINGREHFEQEIIAADVPCVVNFWSPGCASCVANDHDFEGAAKDFSDEVRFASVNVHTNQEVAQAMRIRRVPTVVIFRGTAVFDVRSGRCTQKNITRMAQRVLDKENNVGLLTRLKRFLNSHGRKAWF